MLKNLKILIPLIVISIFFFIKISYKNFQCTKYGNLIFDKIIGINSNCYERKLQGVVNPHIINSSGRYSYTDNKKVLKCPKNAIVVLVSGQSNSANFLRSKKRYKNKHYNYFDGKCYELSNPVLGAEGEMSSIIPAIANKLNNFEDIIFVTSGWGGLSIKDANDKSKIFINYNKNILEKLEKNNNYLKFFVWIQGESDADNSLDYIKNFNSMFANITKNLKYKKNIELIITQTTKCYNKEDENLRKKQKLISNSHNKLLIPINTDNFGDKFRYDQCHFNEFGIDKISFEISKIIKKFN